MSRRPPAWDFRPGKSQPVAPHRRDHSLSNRSVRRAICPDHGPVNAHKAVPAPYLPFLPSVIRGLLAAIQPYRCPACGAKVTHLYHAW